MTTTSAPDATVERLVSEGRIEFHEMDETSGRLTLSGSWATMTIEWNENDWAFRVLGTQEASGWTGSHNCVFSYESELGEALSERIAEATL